MVTIMRESTVKILDDKDMEFVETLRSLGVPRNVATLITFLANVDEASSREIEMGSDLRQPEVSIAMRTLRDNQLDRGEGDQARRQRQTNEGLLAACRH